MHVKVYFINSIGKTDLLLSELNVAGSKKTKKKKKKLIPVVTKDRLNYIEKG
jgi:hypothetical protein